MLKEVTATGKDVAEAKENARALLGAGELDDVQFEVIYYGSKGIFGIGAKPAQVRATMEVAGGVENKRRDDQRRDRRDNRNGKGDRKGGKPRDSRERAVPADFVPPAEEDKTPREAVIPESELKFTKMEVAEGEDLSFEFVKKLIANLGLDATVELFSCEDGTRRLNIEGPDASHLIGHHGDTMDAVQYLANLASAQKNAAGERIKSRVTVDVEGYRAKREEALRALARNKAKKALKSGKSVMLEPMTAYERRIIHSEIQGIEGVSTNSIGSDNNRKIVIYLTDKKAVSAEAVAEDATDAEDAE